MGRAWMRRTATIFALALATAACGGGDDGGAIDNGSTPDGGNGGNGSDTAQVEVVDIDYEPKELTVAPGTKVVWTNTGQQPHTVTAKNGEFDSSPGCTASDPSKCMGNGDTFEFTFSEAGTFPYFCTFHGEELQSGTITVEG